MKTFTIYYKDHVGRKNQTTTQAKDDFQAQQKFEVLYPDCNIPLLSVIISFVFN